MSNKELNNNKLSGTLICLSKKTKVFYLSFAVYFIALILYDLFVYKRALKEIMISYLFVLIIGIFVWFGVKFVFWLQIKNSLCSERILNVFTLVAIVVFGVSSLIMGVQYFIDDFTVSAFIAPIAITSLIQVQSLRP